jgi:hypothetical protein
MCRAHSSTGRIALVDRAPVEVKCDTDLTEPRFNLTVDHFGGCLRHRCGKLVDQRFEVFDFLSPATLAGRGTTFWRDTPPSSSAHGYLSEANRQHQDLEDLKQASQEPNGADFARKFSAQ